MQDFIRRTLAETGVEKETPPCIAFFSIFFRVSYIMNKCLGSQNSVLRFATNLLQFFMALG